MNLWKKITVGSFFAFLSAFALAALAMPDADISRMERRKLAQLPEFTAEKLLDGTYGKKLEEYLLDQFPGRNIFRTIKAETETTLLGKKDSNGYVQLADGIYKLNDGLDEGSIRHAAKQFVTIRENLFADANAYYAVIPERNYFLAENQNASVYPTMDYDRLNQLMQENMTGFSYIDIYGYLEAEDYYRTDLHWRQEKITDVAEALLAGMQRDAEAENGKENSGTEEESMLVENDSSEENASFAENSGHVDGYEMNLATDNFYGGYAGASAFHVNPEELYYLTNSVIENASVYDYETRQETTIYAPEWLDGTDPYDFYLWGARALLTIKNPQQENGKKLIIFRDSFGSSITPLLLSGYSEITLADLRYVSANYLPSQIDTGDYDDVLFLYSTELLNSSGSLKPF